MARLKALQTRQWWEEFEAPAGVRYMGQPAWLSAGQTQRSLNPDKIGAGQPTTNTVSLAQPDDTTIRITLHAERRMAQRNLTNKEVGIVVLYGQTWHKTGAIIRYLRRKDMPHAVRADERWQRLVGATVVMARDERTVITAYRNSGLKYIRCKPDYGWN